MISTSIKVANIIINEINSEFNNSYLNICDIYQNKIYCLMDYYNLIKDKNLKLYLYNDVKIEIPFDLLIMNKTKKYFNLNIEIYEFNIDKNQNILKVGKFLFDLYFVIFDAENKRIGFKKLEEKNEIKLERKYHYTNIFPYKIKNNLDTNKIIIIKSLFFIVILLCFIGIILLLYGKNNYYYYI